MTDETDASAEPSDRSPWARPTDEPPGAAAEPRPGGQGAPSPGPDPSQPEPSAPALPPVEPPSLAGPVGAREILWKGLDLNLAASRDVRRAAILIGLLALGAAGPVVAALFAVGDHFAGLDVAAPFDPDLLSEVRSVQGALLLQVLIAVGAFLALSIDSQLLAVDVLARKATGRTFGLRSSLEIVRMRFWRLLRANILIGIILFVPRWVIDQLVAPGGAVRESQLVVETLLGVLLSIPFAYVAAWILLGQVGARESVRRSWRLARSRPSLALVIAIVNTLVQTLAVFALGAGIEILFRITSALGLEDASGVGLIPLAILIGLGIVAVGSLVMTIAALAAGPQVTAFLRMTGDASGLDVLRDPDNPFSTPRTEPLVTRGMRIAIVVEVLLLVVIVAQLS